MGSLDISALNVQQDLHHTEINYIQIFRCKEKLIVRYLDISAPNV